MEYVRTSPGTYDETTDTWTTPVTSSIAGSGIELPDGDPDLYKALGLTVVSALTHFFTPSAYNLRSHTADFVLPGDTLEWNDIVFTVKGVRPIAIDGMVISAWIVVVR